VGDDERQTGGDEGTADEREQRRGPPEPSRVYRITRQESGALLRGDEAVADPARDLGREARREAVGHPGPRV